MKQKTTILLLFVFLSIFVNLPELEAYAAGMELHVSNFQKEIEKGEKYIFDVDLENYGSNRNALRYVIDDGEWVTIPDIAVPYRMEIDTEHLDYGYHKLTILGIEDSYPMGISSNRYSLTFKVIRAIDLDVYNIEQTKDILAFDVDDLNKKENISYDLYMKLGNRDPEVLSNIKLPYRMKIHGNTPSYNLYVSEVEIWIRSRNYESDHYFLTALFIENKKIYTPPDTSSRPLAQNPKPVSTSSAASKLKPSSSQPTSAAPLDHNSTAVWIVFAAAGLVLIAGAVSFVLIRKKKK